MRITDNVPSTCVCKRSTRTYRKKIMTMTTTIMVMIITYTDGLTRGVSIEFQSQQAFFKTVPWSRSRQPPFWSLLIINDDSLFISVQRASLANSTTNQPTTSIMPWDRPAAQTECRGSISSASTPLIREFSIRHDPEPLPSAVHPKFRFNCPPGLRDWFFQWLWPLQFRMHYLSPLCPQPTAAHIPFKWKWNVTSIDHEHLW
jgi:hypothetical protein